MERLAELLPGGGWINQGDHATIDARSYVMHITVEQRAELLAEVGAALRPVLQAMQDRIVALEQETLPLRRAELPPGPCPQKAPPGGLHTLVEHAPADVGSDV